jgi:hypothetical protein
MSFNHDVAHIRVERLQFDKIIYLCYHLDSTQKGGKMKRIATILLLFVNLVFPTFGQRAENYSANEITDYALKNTQQKGDFYFLPFPSSYYAPKGFSYLEEGTAGDKSWRAYDAQIVLHILDGFEKSKGVEVISFQLIRDQDTRVSRSKFYGIFVKARKR